MPPWDRFVCVDWAKELRGRRAWIAEIGARSVTPADVTPTLADLLAFARALPGRTVVAIDAALGVPRFYLERARRAVPAWRGAEDFLGWVALAIQTPGVLREARTAREWRHDRPFIAVPRGRGALTAFWTRCGGKLARRIDEATGAKSPFVVAGIPGSVGAGSRALWVELAQLLGASDLAIWPFDGPRWVREHDVSLCDLALARADPDHFDAMISAAAMLRCALGGHPLDAAGCDAVEGAILGLPSVRLDGPRRARQSESQSRSR